MKLFKNLNDYELLYYIYDGSEWALNMMFEKYRYLIESKINRINVKIDKEEFLLEGYSMLYKAIQTYNQYVGKSFMRYFEFILLNRFKTLLKEYINKEKLIGQLSYLSKMEDNIDDYVYDIKDVYYHMNDGIEKDVYKYVYVYGYSIKDTSDMLGCESKKIYNTLYSIKNKIKKFNNDNK